MPPRELILAIETSSRTGSVAIGHEDELWVEKTFSGEMRHSTEILPSIRGLLAQVHATPDDLKQVYLSRGPGSFTGLRIGVTLAKAMALANAAKIVAVNTLDVIAANVPATNDMCQILVPILDAKRNHFFVGVYGRPSADPNGLHAKAHPAVDRVGPDWEKIQPDTIMTAEQLMNRFKNPNNTVGFIGDGLLYHQDRFKAEGIHLLDRRYWTPTAAHVFRLGRHKARCGEFEDPLRLTPLYLMPPEVTLNTDQKSKIKYPR
jgi:tRNA threonylcarbamoyladenosine biosynthesis protein TsaB